MGDELTAAQERIRVLEAALREAEKDAARYRYVRANGYAEPGTLYRRICYGEYEFYQGEHLDAAVDAALAAKPSA